MVKAPILLSPTPALSLSTSSADVDNDTTGRIHSDRLSGEVNISNPNQTIQSTCNNNCLKTIEQATQTDDDENYDEDDEDDDIYNENDNDNDTTITIDNNITDYNFDKNLQNHIELPDNDLAMANVENNIDNSKDVTNFLEATLNTDEITDENYCAEGKEYNEYAENSTDVKDIKNANDVKDVEMAENCDAHDKNGNLEDVKIEEEQQAETSILFEEQSEVDCSIRFEEQNEVDSSILVDEENEFDSSILVEEQNEVDSSIFVEQQIEADSSILVEEQIEADSSILVDEVNGTDCDSFNSYFVEQIDRDNNCNDYVSNCNNIVESDGSCSSPCSVDSIKLAGNATSGCATVESDYINSANESLNYNINSIMTPTPSTSLALVIPSNNNNSIKLQSHAAANQTIPMLAQPTLAQMPPIQPLVVGIVQPQSQIHPTVTSNQLPITQIPSPNHQQQYSPSQQQIQNLNSHHPHCPSHSSHNSNLTAQNVAGNLQPGPPHTHLFPLHVITVNQPPPPQPGQSNASGNAVATTGAWPLIEAPLYIDANGEYRPFCPAHPHGPPSSREHRVLLQLDAGVSLPLQIAGKRKVFRGPTTVQMVSQNRPPPLPVPVQVPQGQVMQQYVNENGTLTHVLLSPQYQQMPGQGGVPHIHAAPFIQTNGTTSHFYGALAAGFPPGGNPHFHPIPGGHLQPQQMSHSPHSPSPPSNYHKDDRTQRQHSKMLRKLDQKREMNSAMSTPAHSPSPRKNDMNGLRRTSRNGASSVGTSEDGEESSSVPDDEDDCQTIIEHLSSVQKPEVTEITSRSAKLRWEAPPIPESIINIRDLRYDVLLSDRAKEGKYKLIFKGESYVCMIQDLRPGQEYLVRLQVHYEKLQGTASEATIFITPSCEPDQPLPPKIIARTKNSLQLRWTAPYQNGSPIIQYILEYDEGKGKTFVEAAKTKGKQHILTKLQPSTVYCFRLSAVNERGPSMYSDVISYSTTGNIPPTPRGPTLHSNSSSSLRLQWERRTGDEDYVLQMSEIDSNRGFMHLYNGKGIIYDCRGLKRATSYLFRLRSENESGSSAWSEEVTYKTQPGRPGPPSKPLVQGKIHGNSFKAKWDPPSDTGGADIRKYILEISSGGKFERFYSGIEPETVCDRLSPGTTYQIRVSCESVGGWSAYSDISTVTTEAVVPGLPDPPYCEDKPGPYKATICWDSPEYNGGAPILEYEVQLNGSNRIEETIYRGKESCCIADELNPGEDYEAYVRAINRIGFGPWSNALKFSAAAAPPMAPDAPEIILRSANHLTVSWNEPISNGAPILEYRLESSLTNESPDSFNINYQGLQTTTDIRNLVPYTLYYFRVNASNLAGCSEYSPIVSTKTPAAVPGTPQFKYSERTATEVTLAWSEPDSNGTEILYYVIEFGDNSITTDDNCTEYKITNLASETSYKFKIQAVNAIGAGQFSNPLKLVTLPPPPEPPKLDCTGVGYNFIKLKWGEGKNLDFTEYYVEMFNNRAKEFQLVYKGTNFMCKVNKLIELTTYLFRISAGNDRAGRGNYSEQYEFKTSANLPSIIKPPRVALEQITANSVTSNNTPSGSSNLTTGTVHHGPCSLVTLEWQHSKNTFVDPVEYILQYASGKDGVYTEIYRGPDTKFTIENLEIGSVYLFRVCPIRVTSSNAELFGQFSIPLRYQVPQKLTIDCVDGSTNGTNSTHHHSNHHQHNHNHNHSHNHSHNHNHNHNTHHHQHQHQQLNTANLNHLNHRSNPINNGNNNGSSLTSTISSTMITNSHQCQQQLPQQQQLQPLITSNDVGNYHLNEDQSIRGNRLLLPTNIGAIRRLIGKVTALYTNRRRFTDQQKAVIFMVSFLFITFLFAAIVTMFTS